jgi:hypothetical protein
MYRSSSWTGVAFGRRTMSSATVVGVAAKAFHFEVAKPGVNCIAQRRRRLRRTLKAEHALVPRLDGETIGFLARFRRPLAAARTDAP